MQYFSCHWQTKPPNFLKLERTFYEALTEKNSLTHWLEKQHQSPVTVKVLKNDFVMPCIEEIQFLSSPEKRLMWSREVALKVQEKTEVVARTLLPLPFCESVTHVITHLGSTSLGKFLFKQPHLEKSDYQYRLLVSPYEPFQHLVSQLESKKAYWSRRRWFRLKGYTFSVMEIFQG